MQEQQSDDDLMTLLLLLSGAGGFGLFSFATFVRPLRDWLLEKGVLTEGTTVVFNLGDEVGFDVGRVTIAAGIILVLVAGVIALLVRRFRNV